MKRFFVFLLFLLPLSILNAQDTIHVPGAYSSIQAAINAANNGDIVLVADGTYLENINYNGKAITVASHFILLGDTSHITNTIIDGSQPINPDYGTVVIFMSGEDTTSVLCGFTVTGGIGTDGVAGGIGFSYSGGQIKNNIIEFNTLDNVPQAYGGGIWTNNSNTSNIIVKDNVIRNNICNGTEYAVGGGILIATSGYALISNNKILENTVSASIAATGGGIEVWGPIGEIYIVSNYIKGNTAQPDQGRGGGIDVYDCTTNKPVIENNIIVANSAYEGGGILVDLSSAVSGKHLLTGIYEKPIKMYEPINSSLSSLETLADTLVLLNNTIANNSASYYGGGIFSADMTTVIMNSIVWGNTAANVPQIFGDFFVEYSNIEDTLYSGNGNISVDPQFINTEYYLLTDPTSPCIDAGNLNLIYNDIEHIFNPGHPMPPSKLTLRNDMGHCGGPNSLWCHWQWPFLIDLPSTPILVSPAVGDTIITNLVTFSWEDSDPMVLRYWLELDTTDQFNNYFIDSVVIGNSFEYSGLEVNKNYYWRVRAYNTAGWSEFSEVRTFNTFITSVSENDLLPDVFTLEQNYPNPFNPVTTIRYSIAKESEVSLIVYNTLGEELAELVNESQRIGNYEVELSATELSSGVYFYQIKAGDFVQVRKMMLLK